MIYLNHFFACSSSAEMTNSQSAITLARIVLKKCPEIKKKKKKDPWNYQLCYSIVITVGNSISLWVLFFW